MPPRRRDPRLLLAALLAALAAPAAAVPLDEPVEIGDLALESLLDPSLAAASLHEERASAAPASVFVLTRGDLEAGGFRTLAEALRTVPGLFTYADGFYQYVGVRGAGGLTDYTTRLLVLVDGHPINSQLGFAENGVGLDLSVPLFMVDRIEVVKGPAGGVYGPNAFLGVVNVVTAAEAEPGVEAAASGAAAQGRWQGPRLSGGATGRLGDLRLSVGAEAEWSRGYDWIFPELALATDRPAPPGGRVAGLDGSTAARGYLRAAWRDLALRAGCGHWRRDLPSAPYSTILLDPRTGEESLTCFADLSLQRPVGEHAELLVRLAHDRFDYRDLLAYAPPEPGGGGDLGPFRDRGTDQWTSAEVRLHLRLPRGWRATLGATGEAHDTRQLGQSDALPPITVDPVNGVGVGPIRKRYLTLNTYALAQWEATSGLTLHGSLTWYAHQLFGHRLTPRVAAVWRPSPADTLKAVYAEGFRPPTVTEAFFDDVTEFIPNPDIRPETVRSTEVAYERQVGATLALTASLFHLRYGDLIAFQTVPAPVVIDPDPNDPADFRQQGRNTGSLQAYGGEVGATVRAGAALQAYGGVSLQRPDGPRPNFPRVTANAAVSTRPWRPLLLGLRAAWLSARDKEAGNVGPEGRTRVPAALRLDARAMLDVPGVPGLLAELTLANLLDAVVRHPVAGDFAPLSEMAEPPRTLLLGLRYRR